MRLLSVCGFPADRERQYPTLFVSFHIHRHLYVILDTYTPFVMMEYIAMQRRGYDSSHAHSSSDSELDEKPTQDNLREQLGVDPGMVTASDRFHDLPESEQARAYCGCRIRNFPTFDVSMVAVGAVLGLVRTLGGLLTRFSPSEILGTVWCGVLTVIR